MMDTEKDTMMEETMPEEFEETDAEEPAEEEAAEESTEIATVPEEEKEEPLFSIRVKLTERMTIEYAKHVYLSRRAAKTTLRILTITCLAGSVYFLFKGVFTLFVVLVLMGLGYPMALMKYTTALGRKDFYENLDYHQVPIDYDFYEDHFVMTDVEGPLAMRYDELHSIQQTNNLFLLMASENQGAIIPKKPGTERLQQFLADKEARYSNKR